MKHLSKPVLLLTTVALSVSLTACSNSDTPRTDQPKAEAVVNVPVNPVASVDALTDKGVQAVDSGLNAKLQPELSTSEEYTRVVRDPKNVLHTFYATSYPAGTDNAARFATFTEFIANRAGEFERVDVDGYSWAYVGSEADLDQATPLAGLVARNEDGSVFVCAWSGDYVPNAEEAVKAARYRLDFMKNACEVHAS